VLGALSLSFSDEGSTLKTSPADAPRELSGVEPRHGRKVWDARGEENPPTSQLGKLRQDLARLIDSYAEGLLAKREFEPRITRLRDRIAKVQDQLQRLPNERFGREGSR